MNKKILTENIEIPVSRQDIISKYCTGKSVLDIGCVNHNIDNVNNDNWLHGRIKNVATDLTGVDFLENEVEQMKNKGFNVICADICKPLMINRTFDVIVVGNLIEHLSNFEGLLINLTNLLAKDGIILMSTANPFYIEQYFYSAFRNHILVNEEHTCWIDPVTLDELIRRFGFETKTVYWIKERWQLHWVIMNGSIYNYNVMTGHWTFRKKKKLFGKKYNIYFKTYIQIFIS